MKKAGLFFIVPLVIVLLASCSGSQFGKGSLAINLDEELLEKAFPRTQRNYRAGDDSELYTATLEITGDETYSETKDFTRPEKGKEKVFFTVDNLTPGAVIDIKLSLSCDNLVLYEGTVKGLGISIGTIPVDITLKTTGQFNKFTHAKITFESEHGTAPSEKVVKKGYVLKESDIPALEAKGWIFEGWYAGGERYTVDSEVKTSINLVAKWVAAQLPEEPEEPIVDPTPQEPVEPEPEEPIVDPVEPEPEEPEEGVSFTLEMKVNGTAVADGGDILVGDITNATLAINYENPEDSALNIQGKAKLKVGEDELESDTVYLPMQLNLPSMLNGRTLAAGTYTIEIYLFNDEIEAETPLTFTFNVVDKEIGAGGIIEEVPDFEVVVTYNTDADNYFVDLVSADDGANISAEYECEWFINGTKFTTDSSDGIIIGSNGVVNASTKVYLYFDSDNQNTVVCKIGSKTNSANFGVKAGDEPVAPIEMQ